MKHVLSILLSVVLTLSLFACNRDDSEDTLTQKTLEPIAVDHVWKSDYITYPENVRGTPDPYTLDGDLLRFSGIRVLSEEPYEYEVVEITFDLTERKFTVTPTDE